MKWYLDLDGVITSNPDFFKLFIYHLRKKENKHQVGILTARNPKREFETMIELETWGIGYDEIYFMDKKMDRSFKTQAEWKIKKIQKLKPDIWIDNDFKMYERVFGMDLDELIPGVIRIMI